MITLKFDGSFALKVIKLDNKTIELNTIPLNEDIESQGQSLTESIGSDSVTIEDVGSDINYWVLKGTYTFNQKIKLNIAEGHEVVQIKNYGENEVLSAGIYSFEEDLLSVSPALEEGNENILLKSNIDNFDFDSDSESESDEEVKENSVDISRQIFSPVAISAVTMNQTISWGLSDILNNPPLGFGPALGANGYGFLNLPPIPESPDEWQTPALLNGAITHVPDPQ